MSPQTSGRDHSTDVNGDCFEDCRECEIARLQAVVDAAREVADELNRYSISRPICRTNLHYFKRLFLRALDGEEKP